MSEKVQVKIYGQTYSITGDKTNEQIQEIADYVDERMRLISKIMGRNGTSSTAVLTAVNIGEELFDLKQELVSLQVRMDSAKKSGQRHS